MLNRLLRETWTKVMTPIARLFLRLGISPDVVTVVGTVGVCVGALVFFPRGQLLVGTLVVALFIFSDNVDGVMARMSGRQGPWGAYLGFVVSYSKARAEGLGMTANVGIAERADRLLAVLLATFLVGFGVSVVLLVVVLALLSVASLITVVQRMVAVRRQVLAMSPDQHTPGVSTP